MNLTLGNNSTRAVFAGSLLLAILAGCQQDGKLAGNQIQYKPAPADAINVSALASNLKLRLISSTSACAEMVDRDNVVLVYSDPEGRIFVNGEQVGPSGGMVCVANTIFVPITMEKVIRQALRGPGTRLANNSTIQPRPPQGRKVSGKVVIDAGHGGSDPGTTVSAGHPEKNVNLAIATDIAGILRQKGVETILTRSSDRALDLDERVNTGNRSGANLFVSIHANSSTNASVSGYEVIYPSSSPAQAVKAAQCVASRLSAAGIHKQSVRADIRDLRVLKNARIPAILVETGYMSNRAEAAKLVSTSYQNKIAQAIAEGICDFLAK